MEKSSTRGNGSRPNYCTFSFLNPLIFHFYYLCPSTWMTASTVLFFFNDFSWRRLASAMTTAAVKLPLSSCCLLSSEWKVSLPKWTQLPLQCSTWSAAGYLIGELNSLRKQNWLSFRPFVIFTASWLKNCKWSQKCMFWKGSRLTNKYRVVPFIRCTLWKALVTY